MKSLMRTAIHLWARRWASLLIGTLLTAVVMLAGIALLGLSGWFITAAGVAGAAGAGLTFDVFRPSAGVRFLALGRAAARYGERLSTHDATLQVLADLRVDLLQSFLRKPILELMRIRGSERLQQFTADVDALDGLALRLLMPAVAALSVLTLSFLVIGFLADFVVAGSMVAIFLVFALMAGWLVTVSARLPSRRAHRALWALRMRLIDTLRGRSELALARRLPAAEIHVLEASQRVQQGQSALDLAERKGAFLVAAGATLAAAAVLTLCSISVVSGQLSPECAALAFFAALGLAELVMPLTRGLCEIGKMSDAAQRIEPLLQQYPETAADTGPAPSSRSEGEPLMVVDVVRIVNGQRLLVDDLSFKLKAGETVALVGPSGGGKTTFLNVTAGLREPERGNVLLRGVASHRMPERDRFRLLGYFSQRSSLVSGTVRENLLLAKPDADPEQLAQVLATVRLYDALASRGGLDTCLGEGGRGLSGGETRRLALARILLRRPAILLLDEPTEGLDRETAIGVLQSIREHLPEAAILMASHRPEEVDFADRALIIGATATK
ncbi:thiol reductant ABC exporter subunit CydC [Agrobacterium vitis]